ncbi:MAG TPA: VOC family protein [Burkholderiales bacterium]|nr:VOC family protein [Burkholderiales bacterium]
MAKLRHIAMVVEEMEKTAQFYEKSFGMERVRQTGTAIGLSDGVVSLVIIHPSNVNMKGDDRRGLHHIGFLVDDMDGESARVEKNGAVRHGSIIHSDTGRETERKYCDPNGQVFDLTSPEYARDYWRIAV